MVIIILFMKNNLSIILIVIILIFTNITVIQTEANSSKNKTLDKPFDIETINDKTDYWGLLIAVGEYADNPWEKHWSMFTEVDQLYETLLQSRTWSENHIKVIKGENATFRNIIKGLKWLDKKEDKNDICFVYITTHGDRGDFDFFPKDEVDKRDEYLMTYYSFAVPFTVISDDTLNFYLSRLESKGVSVIIDSCFAGGFNDPPRNKLFTRRNENNRVVIMASREDEVSYSGVFSPYMLDALRGFADVNNDYIVTAEEVFNYTYLRTKKYIQTPTIYDDYIGELPILYLSEEQKEKTKNLMNFNQYMQILSSDEITVYGYIKDNVTNDPVEDASVEITYWEGNTGRSEINHTDSQGFYSFNIPDSTEEICLEITKEGYYNREISWVQVENNITIIWLNESLNPLHENSMVCGYIKHGITNDPIKKTKISYDLNYGEEDSYYNDTMSDDLGFYSMNVPKGKMRLYYSKSGYFLVNRPEGFSDYYTINENEILWLNISMYPIPPENSVIKGFVTNKSTDQPIENLSVRFYWEDDYGNTDYNSTMTDSSGFYSLNVAKGSAHMEFVKDSEDIKHITDCFEIEENTTIWKNISVIALSFNITVCGFVKNSLDNSPINNSHLEFICYDINNKLYENETKTSTDGFYSVKLKPGRISYQEVEAKNYFRYCASDDEEIGDKPILWLNYSLTPIPPRNSIVCGYIKDSKTNKPIENATVDIYCDIRINSEIYYYNSETKTNDLGFYSTDMPAGEITVFASAAGYYTCHTSEEYDLDENEILWVNRTLDPHLPKNAVVCGYIKDAETNNPIEHAYVGINWKSFDYKYTDYHYTNTNYTGFYSFNLSEGKFYLEAEVGGYLFEYSKTTNIYENQVLWVNLSMYKKPQKNSKICGYIKDAETNEPIEDVGFNLEWIGVNWHHLFYDTKSDEDGFYSINVPSGELKISAFKKGYQWEEFPRRDIGKHENLWFNITLRENKKHIDIYLYRPINGLYLKNKLKLPFFKPLVIGDFQIEFYVWSDYKIENVKMFIDDELKLNISNKLDDDFYSYSWTKEKTKLLGHKHTIEVVAADEKGNVETEGIKVWRYL